MNIKNKMKSLEITFRNMCDKHGNPHRLISLIVNGVEVATLGASYGYGDLYLKTATEWLEKNEYLGPDWKEKSSDLREYCEGNSIEFDSEIQEYDPMFLSWCKSYKEELDEFKRLISAKPSDVSELREEVVKLKIRGEKFKSKRFRS